jgi:uncharacterized membrane protein YhaH (DUF805 family)
MNFPTAVSTCLAKYVTFTGRARRSEFWYYELFAFLAAIAAMIADQIVDPPVPGTMSYGLVYALVMLGLLLPSLAVAVRRLHDTDRSGFWLFIAFVPFVGAILLIVWYCTKGTTGDNRFGPDPAP